MTKVMYTEVLKTTNLAEYKQKEEEFLTLNDKTKSMLTTFYRKVTFKSNSSIHTDYSIVMEDMETIYIEEKTKDENIVTKDLICISEEDANAILEGDFSFMKASDDSRLQRLYGIFTELGLKPAYSKEFTRKTFHQNKFLDILFDISMSRKPYESKKDFFAPRKFGFKADYSNLRMSIRHYLSVTKPMEALLAFEKSLAVDL